MRRIVLAIASVLFPMALAGQSGLRRIVPGSWNRVWTVGGSEADTLLMAPGRLIVTDDLVYVLDYGGRQVIALRLETGQVAWIYSKRGQGPGEISQPQALAPWPGGGVAVADIATRRLTAISPQGRFLETVTPQVSMFPHGLCTLGDGSILVHGPGAPAALGRFTPRGAPLPYPEFPDPSLRRAKWEHQLGLLAAGNGRCYLALQSLGRIFALGESGVVAAWNSVERFDLADTAAPPAGRDPRIGPPTAAIGIAADHDTVLVAFDGRSTHSGRIIDLYASAGEYLGSVAAPRPPVNRIVALARSRGIWVMIHGIDLMPAVSAFRFAPAPGR